MNQSVGYLREVLSRYIDHSSIGLKIYNKIEKYDFPNENEKSFISQLSSKEINFLNHILLDEIKYANDEQDKKRASHLNEIYELL